jgi:ABC-type nitrate/sulfonate/bicarbonate transport system substrate-binding protein
MSITRRHILATFAAASVLGTSAMAQAADTVRIGLPTKTYWPTTIAETAVRQKLFDKEGIKAELTIYRGGAETFEAMAAGAADVILDATSLVSAGRTKGVNSKVVANAAMGYYGWQLMTPTCWRCGPSRTRRSNLPACRSAAAAWCRTCSPAMSRQPWSTRR